MANLVEYRQGDIFSAPSNEILVHACNAKGKWGAGIASTFRKYYPGAYARYEEYCKNHRFSFSGHGFLAYDDVRPVGCLVTSKGYGPNVDSVEEILDNTYLAVSMLLDTVGDGVTIHSPKINSKLFRVPWEKTERVINEVLSKSNKNIKWVVWEYDS